MTDADDEVVDALDWFGIDSPEYRWLAARDYLNEWQQTANDAVDEYQVDLRRQISAVFLIADYADLCEANAMRRGEAEARCVGEAPCECSAAFTLPERLGRCMRAWGPRISPLDEETACATILGRYRGRVRERAAEILEPLMLRSKGIR